MMQYSSQIVLRGIARSETLEGFIRDEVRGLERVCDRITSCNILAEAAQGPDRAQVVVRVNIALPGTEVVVTREHAEDVYAALRDAFAAAGLQLRDHMRRISEAARTGRA